MKRIFPLRYVLLGLFLGALALFIFFLTLFGKNEIGFKALFGAVFLFFLSLFFLTSHTAYDSEFIVSWRFFCKKTIRIEDILQIKREWIRSSKSGTFHWTVSHWDRENQREIITTLPLPASYKNKEVVSFIDFIKSVNYKIDFVLNLQ